MFTRGEESQCYHVSDKKSTGSVTLVNHHVWVVVPLISFYVQKRSERIGHIDINITFHGPLSLIIPL